MTENIFCEDDEVDLLEQQVIALSLEAETEWRLRTDQLFFNIHFGEPPLATEFVYPRLKKVASKLRRHIKKRLSRQMGSESLAHRPSTSDWDKLWRRRRNRLPA